jgi:molecular chaperone GrpE
MLKQEIELTAEEGETMSRGKKPTIDPDAELPPPEEDAVSSSEGIQAQADRQTGRETSTELEQLRAERDQLLERLARLQAEFENSRKRADRERVENRDFVTANVVEQFLPVLDNFELALKSKGSAEQLRSGVELIVKQMDEVLGKMQVSATPALGEEFDPRVHEALGSVDRDDIPDQHIAEEIRRGYKLRDRLIRPALVRVARNARQVNE